MPEDEFISVSGRFLVAVYTISCPVDFNPGRFHPCPKHRDKCHPGMKRGENFHENGVPGMKISCVNSIC